MKVTAKGLEQGLKLGAFRYHATLALRPTGRCSPLLCKPLGVLSGVPSGVLSGVPSGVPSTLKLSPYKRWNKERDSPSPAFSLCML